MKITKFISALLIFLIVFSTFSGVVQANVFNQDTVPVQTSSSDNDSNTSTEETKGENGSNPRYIENMFNINGIVEEENDVGVDEFLEKYKDTDDENTVNKGEKTVQASGSQSIPESFDLRDKIKINVENQNGEGLCWAFAALGALRTHLALKQGEGTETPDLSEWHMNFLTSKYCNKGFNRESGDGGYFGYALDYYKNNDGPVLEEDCPYESDIDVNDESAIQKLDDLKPAYYVHETITFPSIRKQVQADGTVKITNNGKTISDTELKQVRDLIKQHIMTNGGLYCSIRTNAVFVGNNLGEPYNTYDGKWSQYDDGSIADSECGSHGVTIIGWDDNYSKDKFYAKNKDGQIVHPKNNGAYLVVNSYGSDSFEEGYQWISYEDSKVEGNLSGYTDVDTTENMYEYTFTNKSTYELIKKKASELGISIETNDDNKEIKVLDLIINTDLIKLDLSGLELTDIDLKEIFKYNIKNLTSLNLSGNKITDISPLSKLTSLEKLWLSKNNIEDITPLAKLTKLKELYIEENKVQDISELTKLTNLENLWLNKNNIKDISQLTKLTKLKELHMEELQLKDISNISKLTNLEKLVLNKNNIEDITPLLSLAKLTHLSLFDNKIEDISKLNRLTNLIYLNLNKNKITDFSSLDFDKYETIFINGQQISENVSSRTTSMNYPTLFLNAKNKNDDFYSEEGFEFTGCKENSNGTGITLDANIETAKVKIKSGIIAGTEWTISVVKSNKKPVLVEEPKYYYSDKDYVYALITADEPIKINDKKSASDWSYCNDDEQAKKYGSTVTTTEKNCRILLKYKRENNDRPSKEEIEIINEDDNAAIVNIEADTFSPKLTVTKDPNGATNKNVTVAVEADEDITLVSGENWTISSKRKLIKTYSESQNETIIVQDAYGNKTTQIINVSIENKDDNKDNENKENNKEDSSKNNNSNQEEKKQTDTSISSEEKNNNPSNDTKNNTSQDSSTITNENKGENLAPYRLPQTGAGDIIFFIIIGVIMIAVIVCGGLYIRYKKSE